MNKEKSKNSISEEVVSRIESGEVKMRSKKYFFFRAALVVGFLSLLSFFVLYLGSLIIFVFRANDIILFSGMGFHGFRVALLVFPWYLIILVLLLMVLVEFMGTSFSFVYRRPLIYSLLGIVIFVLLGSFLVDILPVHRPLFDLAKQERLPVMGGMYRHLGDLDIDDAHFGEILGKEGDVWVMKLESGDTVYLEITERVKGFRLLETIKSGNQIVVIGEREEDIIKVSGFRRLNSHSRGIER
ncbi:MAG: hypothetical protein WDZ85_03050 [Candidatus Paceibacterota bacterium]